MVVGVYLSIVYLAENQFMQFVVKYLSVSPAVLGSTSIYHGHGTWNDQVSTKVCRDSETDLVCWIAFPSAPS